MALLEAAVVVYLRAVFHITGELVASTLGAKDIWFSIPYFTLLKPAALTSVLPRSSIAYLEVVREVATIVMLLCVGWLGGATSSRARRSSSARSACGTSATTRSCVP